MSKVPTPRIFDRKKTETPPAVPPLEEESMIEYRETKIVEGVQEFKIHRVPVKDWAAYAKENGL